MAIDSFPVEASHILMFARAVGDDNPVYATGTEEDGVLAPPTFMQASAQFDPDYFLRPKIGQPWFGSGKEPTGLKPTAEGADSGGGDNKAILHAEQHFEYHRHPRAGDVLAASVRAGKRWEKEGKRSGKLVFSETITEYRNQDGELMVTATGVGVTP
jgi:hypothetical protein